MDFYYAWLAIANYFDGRTAESIATSQKMSALWDVNMAAAYVRLGKFEEARASIARLLKNKPGWTIQKEAVWSIFISRTAANSRRLRAT